MCRTLSKGKRSLARHVPFRRAIKPLSRAHCCPCLTWVRAPALTGPSTGALVSHRSHEEIIKARSARWPHPNGMRSAGQTRPFTGRHGAIVANVPKAIPTLTPTSSPAPGLVRSRSGCPGPQGARAAANRVRRLHRDLDSTKFSAATVPISGGRSAFCLTVVVPACSITDSVTTPGAARVKAAPGRSDAPPLARLGGVGEKAGDDRDKDGHGHASERSR